MINRRHTISTPDHVELELELAGLGSRFGAFAVDMMIVALCLVVLSVVGLLALGTIGGSPASFAWVLALALLAGFLVLWGYFVFFESVFRGVTPGKRVMGLRVLRDDGLPPGLWEAALRNLVRAADLFPPPSALAGGLAILFSPLGKRLGDMAAGTIVVRERFSKRDRTVTGALWMERIERGASRDALTLPGGKLDVEQLTLVERFVMRAHKLPPHRREVVAWRLAEPLFPLLGEDPELWKDRHDRDLKAVEVLEEIVRLARREGPTKIAADDAGRSRKEKQWESFGRKVRQVTGGLRSKLPRLSSDALAELIEGQRRVAADLARARSLGADPLTVEQINRLAAEGHALLNAHARAGGENRSLGRWLVAFPLAIRRHWQALTASAVFLFLPGVIAYWAVQWFPEIGFELVPPSFLDFSPARQDSLHEIPTLARPLFASTIVTNNLQVSLLAFGFGLTAGLGTGLLLIYNGASIGAVAGWLTRSGQERALWGWIMPHGGTELLAIAVAGAAGFILAEAILAPGRLSRREALKSSARDALIIQLGCLAMLVVAGLIEGFVTPSSIAYPGRIAVLASSLLVWFVYLAFAGRNPSIV